MSERVVEKINRCQCVKNKWWNDKWTKFVASRGQLYAHITTHPHVDDDDSSLVFRWAKKKSNLNFSIQTI